QAMLKLPDPVQVWGSGTITLRTELAPNRPGEPEVWVELTELTGQINHRGSDGRITPLVVRVKDQSSAQRAAMSVHATPWSFKVACRAAGRARGERSTILGPPAGDIVLGGHATPRSVQITASGNLDLGKLRVLLDQRFDYVTGNVRLLASLTGAFDKPTFEA